MNMVQCSAVVVVQCRSTVQWSSGRAVYWAQCISGGAVQWSSGGAVYWAQCISGGAV